MSLYSSHDKQPVFNIGDRFKFKDIVSVSLDPEKESGGDMQLKSRDCEYPIGVRLILLGEHVKPYLSIRPFEPTEGYEFDDEDADPVKRRAKHARLGRMSARALSRNKQKSYGDIPMDLSVHTEVYDSTYIPQNVQPDEVAQYLQKNATGLLGVMDGSAEQMKLLQNARLQIFANGTYQSTRLTSDSLGEIDTTNVKEGTITSKDYHTSTFYPLDFGEVCHSIGDSTNFSDMQSYIVGTHISFTLREVLNEEIEMRFVVEDENHSHVAGLLPNDPRNGLDDPL